MSKKQLNRKLKSEPIYLIKTQANPKYHKYRRLSKEAYMRKLSKPVFITIEGIEGSGKTSQIANIIHYFAEKGESVTASREPGGTEIADQIRKILVEPHQETLEALAELLLYNAARVQHLTQVIQPSLSDGQTVICDRFTDATIAYQAYGRKLPLGTVTQINDLATGGLNPDLTFLLDCTPEIGLERSLTRLAMEKSPEGRFEAEALSFHKSVRNGYLEIAARQKDRIVVIDATGTENEIWEAIKKVLDERID
jgi:dTMP kinase